MRPGWFDYNAPGQHRLTMLQADTRWAGDSSDGVIARTQIAQILLASLTSDAADRKTLELVAEDGAAQTDVNPLFAALQADPPGALDGVRDRDNMPLAEEPPQIVAEYHNIQGRWPA